MQLAASVPISVWEMLRARGAAGAAERGHMHMLSFAAIREAVGLRWSRHQDLVEDYVMRSFRRSAREDDFIVRVNDADYILIQPGWSSVGALSRASQLMRETLSHFLGSGNPEDVRIAIVDHLRSGAVEATAAPADQLERCTVERAQGRSGSHNGSPPWERFGVTSALRKTVVIRRPDAASLRVLFDLEPVWNLAQEAVAAFRIRSVILQEAAHGGLVPIKPQDLTPGCHLELALRRAEFGEEIWETGSGPPPAMHLEVDFSVLTASCLRTVLISRLAALKEEARHRRLILELTDVPGGSSAVTLGNLVCQIKPFGRGVLAHAGCVADIKRWQDVGLCGVIQRTSACGSADAAPLTLFAAAARDARMAAALYGVSTHSQFMRAWAAGFSHLSGELISLKLGSSIVPRRFAARDLYTRTSPYLNTRPLAALA